MGYEKAAADSPPPGRGRPPLFETYETWTLCPAQLIARALRERGYSAARDIIPRRLEESLAYARRMLFRQVMVIGAEGAPVRVIRTTDGSEREVALQAILDGEYIL